MAPGIGAGFYVLIGAVAGRAGIYAPWSFVIAATVMALTVASYASDQPALPERQASQSPMLMT